jgi:RNA polymerase sigma-70 factor (ECF subfamily)
MDDDSLWADLYARFRAPLFAYFLRRVQDHAEAEDLTQEAFARLARHPTISQGAGARAYIFAIATNLLTDRVRTRQTRKANEHRSFGDALDNEEISRQLVEDRDPERVLVAKETLKGVMATLEELNTQTREIFILSRLEHVRHRDIAHLYDISVSAVEKHVMKALAILGARFLQP